MRWLLVALIIGSGAGCGARSSQGPAWPKAAERETDGGESLAPRQPTVAAVEADAEEDEDDEEKPAAAGVAITPAVMPAGTVPGATAPTATAPEEIIITEEIVIEIDD